MSNSNVYKTSQENFWKGQFGDDYINRNKDPRILTSNLNLFTKIISRTNNVHSVIEFGSNIGLNLIALNYLIPNLSMSAVEINENAVKELKSNLNNITVFNESILTVNLKETYDFVLTKGILIHINPDELPSVYDKMYNASSKYICIMEYYNPTPVTVNYRGHEDKLFKRDFAGEMMDLYADLELIDYGFCYHRDYNFPQDDGTWFLLKKSCRESQGE